MAARLAPGNPATRYPMNATVITTGCDHGDGDGVGELLLRQPVEILDHTLVQEGHDGQAAAEDERARLGEEQQDVQKDRLAAVAGDRCVLEQRHRLKRWRAAPGHPRPTGRSLRHHCEEAGEHEEDGQFGA